MTSISTLRMGYLDNDDRLLLDLVSAEGTLTLLLTRRLTRRMIAGMAQMLSEAGKAMERVPASHRTDMLIWEHLSAQQPAEAGGGESSPLQRRPGPWPLLLQIDITPHAGGYRLRYTATDGQVADLDVTRGELHRLLATMRQLARHAEWDLDAEVDWLAEADSPAALRPGSLAS
jgi:hypothetical protein